MREKRAPRSQPCWLRGKEASPSAGKMIVNSAQFAASNDLDLVHPSKKGDVAAFEQLVKR